jgi:hypothetical protein
MTNLCSLAGTQRRSNPSSPFDKLRGLSLSRGWIAAPSFLGLAMTMEGVKQAAQQRRAFAGKNLIGVCKKSAAPRY